MKRGNDHLRAQKKGKERDMYRCQLCGTVHQAEGHHIIDYQYGGRASEDNIITLCHTCHKEVHQGKKDIYFF